MNVACPSLKCSKGRWTATGKTDVNKFNRLRAQLLCGECGRHFSSGLQEAIDACNVVRAEQGIEPVVFGIVKQESAPVRSFSVPAPGLPMPIVRQQPTVGFSPVSKMAADFKARQSGEREAGEEG